MLKLLLDQLGITGDLSKYMQIVITLVISVLIVIHVVNSGKTAKRLRILNSTLNRTLNDKFKQTNSALDMLLIAFRNANDTPETTIQALNAYSAELAKYAQVIRDSETRVSGELTLALQEAAGWREDMENAQLEIAETLSARIPQVLHESLLNSGELIDEILQKHANEYMFEATKQHFGKISESVVSCAAAITASAETTKQNAEQFSEIRKYFDVMVESVDKSTEAFTTAVARLDSSMAPSNEVIMEARRVTSDTRELLVQTRAGISVLFNETSRAIEENLKSRLMFSAEKQQEFIDAVVAELRSEQARNMRVKSEPSNKNGKKSIIITERE